VTGEKKLQYAGRHVWKLRVVQ